MSVGFSRSVAFCSLTLVCAAAGVACSRPAATPVVAIRPVAPPTKAAPRSEPLLDPEETFDELMIATQESVVHSIVRSASEFEASNRTEYAFDARLRLRLVQTKWSSEGNSGGATVLIENGVVRCMRTEEGNQGPGPWVMVFCVGAGGRVFNEELPDGTGDDAPHAIMPNEYESLLKDAAALLSGYPAPAVGEDGTCSTHEEGEPQRVGEETYYTPHSDLDVPQELCEHAEQIADALAAVELPTRSDGPARGH